MSAFFQLEWGAVFHWLSVNRPIVSVQNFWTGNAGNEVTFHNNNLFRHHKNRWAGDHAAKLVGLNEIENTAKLVIR